MCNVCVCVWGGFHLQRQIHVDTNPTAILQCLNKIYNALMATLQRRWAGICVCAWACTPTCAIKGESLYLGHIIWDTRHWVTLRLIPFNNEWYWCCFMWRKQRESHLQHWNSIHTVSAVSNSKTLHSSGTWSTHWTRMDPHEILSVTIGCESV